MQRTRLYDTHLALGGRIVPFAGWEMPIQYAAGPLAEHHAVRHGAGLFDIAHMGRLQLRGRDVQAFLQFVQVHDIESVAIWDAHYSLLLYEDGTIVDDIFLYHLPDHWLMVVNAANREKDLAWLQAHTHGYDVSIQDISAETYMLAVQGPRAEQLLQEVATIDLSQVATRAAAQATVAGVDLLLGRTGYTGEDGFELYLPAEHAQSVWNSLLSLHPSTQSGGEATGLLPCGLAARDSLRFEACMALYGHEIDATTNPYEARLGWVVSLNKPDFLGRESLLKAKLEPLTRILVGFEMVDRAVPRQGYPILVKDEVAGSVTSGMKSPTLDRFLGLGYVPYGHHQLGTEVDVLVRGVPKRARIVKRPFYQPRYKT